MSDVIDGLKNHSIREPKDFVVSQIVEGLQRPCVIDMLISACLALRISLLEQNNIGGSEFAGHGQRSAIGRPTKIVDLCGGDIRNLMSRRTIQWLQPKIPNSLLDDRVSDILAIRSKANAAGK